MRITSFGAAGGVTGSKHLLEANGHKVLFDCGMFQGKRQEAFERNRHLGFNPQEIDSVVLSHAHMDHAGTLPILARHGYQGRIFTTPATRDLCAVMLIDSANIQEKDARWLSRKHQTFVPPTYTEVDARAILKRFISVPYELSFEAAPGIHVTFYDAGHVLGSAMCMVTLEENGRRRKFLYSGDIGRKNMAILADPWEPADADVVMMESTYGDRDHAPIETLEDDLERIINKTAHRRGKVIVPTFALERAQEFIYALKRLEAARRIPPLPVYVDSPLTVNVTEVFRLHSELFDDEMRELIESEGDPFHLRHIEYIRSQERSMELNGMEGPAIIIAASGMCEYGRIVHHLKNNIEDPKNTVLIIGFQAHYTLGRKLVDGERDVRILGMAHRVRAEIEVLTSLSAHAGRSELLDFGARLAEKAERFLLVHGEETALAALKSGLESRGCRNVAIQEEGVPVDL